MSETKRKRNNEIVNERLAGRTYRSIGEEYGLSTNRVRQICEKENAIKRYQERMKKKRIVQAEREKYLDEHGRLDGLTPRLYNAVRRGGADTKDELVDMLCSEDGIEVRNVGSKSIAELEELVGFKIERVMKYTTTQYGFSFLSGSELKKEVDPQ